MPTDRRDDDNQRGGLLNRHEAFHHFATFDGPTQSQQHIKPLHRYVTTRLVLEGGFAPDELRPRPPLDVVTRRGGSRLVYAPDNATSTEATILGGLKTKDVDIVVTKEGIGPVLAISCKGMTGAFRNLTNRLEETIGECTNIHIGYPMLMGEAARLLPMIGAAGAATRVRDPQHNSARDPPASSASSADSGCLGCTASPGPPIGGGRQASSPSSVATPRRSALCGRRWQARPIAKAPAIGKQQPHRWRQRLDREHYLDQLRPVAEPVLAALRLDFDQVVGDDRQLALF